MNEPPVIYRRPERITHLGEVELHIERRTDPQADRQGRRGGDQGTDSVVEVAPDGTVTVLRTVEVSR